MTPEGWRSAELGAIAQVNPEQLKHRTDPDYVLEYLDIAAIERPGVIGASRTLTLADAPSRARRRARAGDILVSTVRPYLRNFARVGEAPSNLVASTGYAVVRPANGVDGRFLYQHVLSDAFVEFLKPRMRGSNYPAVKADDVKTYTLSLPPLPEQRKIAAILSSVDDAIEKTQAVIAQVQVVKRGLMQELLTRGLPGRHTRFKQTEIGKIPEEWDFLPLRAMAASDRGLQTGPFGSQLHASDYVINGVPVLMPQDMMNGYVSDAFCARIADERAAELSRHRVQAGDILFARRGDLGRAGLITQHEEGWLCGTGCLRFRPKNRTVSRYLRHWIAWSTSVQWLNKHAVGQTMLNLNTSILGSLPVALPCDAERSVIIGVLEAFDEQIRTLEQNTEGLGGVKSALMSILLTGELRVTPDAEVA